MKRAENATILESFKHCETGTFGSVGVCRLIPFFNEYKCILVRVRSVIERIHESCLVGCIMGSNGPLCNVRDDANNALTAGRILQSRRSAGHGHC